MSWECFRGRDPFDMRDLERQVSGFPSDDEIVPVDDRQLPVDEDDYDNQWEDAQEDM